MFGVSWQNNSSNNYKNIREAKGTPGLLEATEHFLKNVLHNTRVKGLTEPRQTVRKPKAVSEASSVQGKFRGNQHLTPQCPGTPLHLSHARGKGGEKMESVPKAELISSRFVRVFPPIGHHTLPT